MAGIIAANTSGITETASIPGVPFIGVAPQVTLGACKCRRCFFFQAHFYIFVSVGKIECLDVMTVLHPVCQNFSMLLELFVLTTFFNLCLDVITEAIYRAYDDKADISECFRLIKKMTDLSYV